MNIYNFTDFISSATRSLWDWNLAQDRNEGSSSNLRLITGIATEIIAGIATLFGVWYCKKRWNDGRLINFILVGKGLTNPPNISSYPRLKHLDLNNNELTAAPDVSNNHQLEELELYANCLTVAPDVSHNPGLRSLYLSINELTAAPNVSQNPLLTLLFLDNNQLTVAPNVSQNPLLTHLFLYNNQLTVAPNVSQNPQLTHLYLQNNQLTVAPDVSNNPQLQDLNLSYNQLAVAPDVSNNHRLKILNLNQTQLTTPPNVSNNHQLRYLSLISNQLTIAPDVSNNPQLRDLNLSYNQLTTPPHVSNNYQLRYLRLTSNQLTEIPDSYLSLSSDLEIILENNPFSAEYLTAFQARLQAHRAAHPGQGPRFLFSIRDSGAQNRAAPSLQDQLNSWVAEFTTYFPQAPAELDLSSLLSDAEEIKGTLSRYLSRLRDIKDYKAGGEDQKNVIRRVYEMIKLASENADFKEKMLAIIREGTETCGDRVLIVFNDLEILAQFHQNLSPDEYRALAIRASRYEELKKYAQTICRDHRLGDEIETILYFQLQLKEALNLPISTNKMLYPGMAGVNHVMLYAAKTTILDLSDEELLAKSHYWQARMEREYPEAAQEIKDRYSVLSEQLVEYDLSDEKESFLAEHPDLKGFLDRATAKGVIIEYNSLARFCSEERALKIASIDGV